MNVYTRVTHSSPRRSGIIAAVLRLALLAAAVGLPLLAFPASAHRDATRIESQARAPGGAGFVIMMGLRRAR